MSLIMKAKKVREFARNLKQVKQEMREVPGKGGVKVKARKAMELRKKLQDIRGKMTDWEVGELGKEADKEGKKLSKLIELAEARERVANAKVSVSLAQERLRVKHKPGVTLKKKPKTKITFSRLTVKTKPKLPKRRAPRITKPTPRLRR